MAIENNKKPLEAQPIAASSPAMMASAEPELQQLQMEYLRLEIEQRRKSIAEAEQKRNSDLVQRAQMARDETRKREMQRRKEEFCTHRNAALSHEPTTLIFQNHNGLYVMSCSRCEKAMHNLTLEQASIEFKGAFPQQEYWGHISAGSLFGVGPGSSAV